MDEHQSGGSVAPTLERGVAVGDDAAPRVDPARSSLGDTHGMQLRRVVASDLDDLLPLVRDYCRFNGVDHGDEDLLAISRALIADSGREGVQIIARDAHDRPIGFATVVWTWATWAGGRVGIMAICSSPPRRVERVARAPSLRRVGRSADVLARAA